MTGAPLTCTQLAWEVGSQSKDLQRVWFGGGGKMTYFKFLALGDALLG